MKIVTSSKTKPNQTTPPPAPAMGIRKSNKACLSLSLLSLVLVAVVGCGEASRDLCKESPFVGVCRAQVGGAGEAGEAFVASVKSLVKSTRRAKSRSKRLGETSEVCNENYEDAEEELHTVLAAYHKRDKPTVVIYLSAALSDFNTCEDSWEELKGAGTPLLLDNKILHRMASNSLYLHNLIPY